jgi:hypothetical protein
MDNTYASDVSFKIENLSNSTNVITSSNVGKMSRFVLNPLDDLSLFEIILDSVSLVDFRVRESDSSGITSDNVWDFVRSNSFLAHFQQFQFGLSILNFDKSESPLYIIEHSVVFVRFSNRDSVHNADWELD